MKIIYTILFFVDTLLLIVLTYLFLKLMDNGMSPIVFILMVLAIVFCIMLLVYFLLNYLKSPPFSRH